MLGQIIPLKTVGLDALLRLHKETCGISGLLFQRSPGWPKVTLLPKPPIIQPEMPDRQFQPQAQDPGGAYLQNVYGEGGMYQPSAQGQMGSAGVGLRGCFLLPYAAGERERVWATVRRDGTRAVLSAPAGAGGPLFYALFYDDDPTAARAATAPRLFSENDAAARCIPVFAEPLSRSSLSSGWPVSDAFSSPREERLGLPVSHGVILPSVLRPMIQKKRVALFKIQSPALRNKARAVRPRRLFCAVWG